MNTTDRRKPPPRKQRKVKKLLKEAAAVAEGTLIGQYKAHSKKPWLESLKEHLGHWIDNINPLELAAVLGTTVLIKGIIEKSEDLLTKLTESFEQHKTKATKTTRESIMWESGKTLTVGILPEGLSAALYKELDSPTFEFYEWTISFVLAFMLVRHGGQLLGLMKEGTGSLSTIIGAMLA